MRSSRYIMKAISMVLIVLLLQKTAGGLFLHDWLHMQKNIPGHTDTDVPVATAAYGTCSCIDDFYMPFTETAEPVILHTPVIHTVPATEHIFSIPFTVRVFHSLRGPPSIIA